MTDTRRKRPAPMPVRLPVELHLPLAEAAQVAGLSKNAFVVSLIAKAVKAAKRLPRPIKHFQSLAELLATLGEIATTLRDIHRDGLTPDQDAAYFETMQAIKDACHEIMTALRRPGDLS